MEKFIPFEKLSKKKQRELNAKRRTVWTIDPRTRKPKDSNAYDRKKARKWSDDSMSVPFPFIFFNRGCRGSGGSASAKRQCPPDR